MSKSPKAPARRIDPSDRDGDNQPGGSLPGNETAPMLEPGLALVFFALRDAGLETDSDKEGALLPGDIAALTPEEVEAAKTWAHAMIEAHATGDNVLIDAPSFLGGYARTAPTTREHGTATAPQGDLPTDAPPETRDDEVIHSALVMVQDGWAFDDLLTLATVQAWTDEEARAALAWANAMGDTAREDEALPAPAFLQPIMDAALQKIAAETQQRIEQAADVEGETFTAEEIAAGQTEVVEQEGEATATAAEAATTIDADNPLATVQTDTAPVAVRLKELEVLISSRRLYKSPEGYSAIYAAPFIETATVEGWINAGLAEYIPTGGNCGAVRVTSEARSLATRLRREAAEAVA